MSQLMLGGQTIDPRITTGDLRRLKSKYKIDLGGTPGEDSITTRFATDAMTVIDVAFALYGDQVPGVSNAKDFDDLIDKEMKEQPDIIEQLRMTMADNLDGFFPLLKTVCIAMAEAQAGVQVAEAVEKSNPSGTTS